MLVFSGGFKQIKPIFLIFSKGLFEIFSSNSVKTGGILDHETDLISFASRLRKSKLYYVAKELKVYELIHQDPRQSADEVSCHASATIVIDKKNLSRKWVRIPVGSVCRAVRLVSLDDQHSTAGIINGGGKSSTSGGSSFSGGSARGGGGGGAGGHSSSLFHPSWLLHVLKEIICCRYESTRTKKNSDLAIELKLVSDMQQLTTGPPGYEPTFKTYFLPVYESGLDNEIDLVPVSGNIRDNRFKTNTLHFVKNFVLNDQLLLDNFIELKLYDENPFGKKQLSG